jgi:ribosome-associated toxin RatA of RatAB toxin-antitoxin module
MSENIFYWDENGNDTQTFFLGNIHQYNKDQVFDSTYILKNCTPGIPYSIQATVTNALTDESSEFIANEGNLIWFESNISEISFTKDHANLINFTLNEVSACEINVNVTHTLQSYPDLISYTLKYELYTESSTDSQCVSTYHLDFNETDENFPISNLASNTEYNVYYSLLVNPNDNIHNEWYYINTHQHIGVINTPITGNLHFDNQELEEEFICHINSPVSDPPVLDFDSVDFNYDVNNPEQIWTSPGDGTILVWLQGGTGGKYGTYLGGEGGYIAVEIDVQKDVAYKIVVSGPGVDAVSNDIAPWLTPRHGGGGGGASGVFDPITNAWMVIAGGGGGGADRGSGGAGGVPTIWNGTNGGGPNSNSYGKLGTITSVGLGGTGRRSGLAGALHDGGKGGTEGTGPYVGGYGVGTGGLGGEGGDDYGGGGGGGGWFGGGGGGIASDGRGAGGGGGSSYYDGTNTNIALSSTQSAAKYLVSTNGFVRISAVN